MAKAAADYVRAYQALQELGEDALAEALLRRCLVAFPDYLPALLFLSDARFQAGDLAGAWELCLHASQKAHNEIAPHFNLVTVGTLMGHREEQIESHRRILEAHPEKSEFHFALAETLDRLGRAEDSVHVYRRAIELEPENPKFHIHLGYALLRLGHWSEGWDEFAWYFRPQGLKQFSPWALETRKPLLQKGDCFEGKSILVTGWGGSETW